MKITICSTMKNASLMGDLMMTFKQNQIEALFPDLDFKIPDSGMTPEIRLELQNNHFSKIRSSEMVYILTPDKHIGQMVTLEIGYAKALGKNIIFSQRTDQLDLDMFADDFLDVNALINLIKLSP
ncbi:MAG: hypothetical protein PQJ59_13655 [Spirochaetales bacterium]|nr:hypothetical protein [Spirochaetales bacterium]